MKLLVFLLTSSLAFCAVVPAKREATEDGKCRKVPKQQTQQECHMEDVVVKTANLVEHCTDVVTKHCKEQFVPVPLLPFRSSRVVGSAKSLVINGEGSHFTKRAIIHHGLSLGKNCKEVKEKKCHNVPEEKKVQSQVCKSIVSIVYLEECDPIDKTETVEKLILEETIGLQIGDADVAPVQSGYFSFFLPFLILSFGALLISIWLLSILLGMNFQGAVFLLLKPIEKVLPSLHKKLYQ